QHVEQAEDQRQARRHQEDQHREQQAAKDRLPGGVRAEVEQADQQQKRQIRHNQRPRTAIAGRQTLKVSEHRIPSYATPRYVLISASSWIRSAMRPACTDAPSSMMT